MSDTTAVSVKNVSKQFDNVEVLRYQPDGKKGTVDEYSRLVGVG